ncbi:MAG: serine hydrolase domain-containing protein, partial [Bacteroidota bacterium]
AYQYTTYGYVVLGAVIERVSGMEYEAYMKKYIWEPAGMLNTSIERKGVVVANSSKLYKWTDKGVLKKDLKTNLSMKTPGGGILSTAKDLVKFGQAILTHKLIKPETFELMITPNSVKKQGTPYGLGWFIYKNEEDWRGRIIGHSGSQAGCSSQLMILLDKKIVVAVIGNTRRSYNNLWMDSWELLNRASSSERLEKPLRKINQLTAAEVEAIIGSYDVGRGQVFKVFQKGEQLFAQMNKNTPNMLYPESKELLYHRNMEAEFSFDYDASGKLTKASYWQFGQEIPLKRMN